MANNASLDKTIGFGMFAIAAILLVFTTVLAATGVGLAVAIPMGIVSLLSGLAGVKRLRS